MKKLGWLTPIIVGVLNNFDLMSFYRLMNFI